MWRDRAYLRDIVVAARKALRFTQGMNLEQFLQDEVSQEAVMRLVQVIGEAARQLSPEFKAAHPGIPWAGIVAMRNRLVHEYFHVEPAEMWVVIERDLPDLIPRIESLIEPPQ